MNVAVGSDFGTGAGGTVRRALGGRVVHGLREGECHNK